MNQVPNARTPGRIGVVAIGRNEGRRLKMCLESVIANSGRISAAHVVYVDSGSTDGSADLARAHGVEVIDLDMSIPFTAARARNEGFRRLHERAPELDYVQFVDGDCEVAAGWIKIAAGFLDTHSDVAVVSGRLRERYPRRSVYNMLCDIEWDTPPGETHACGGNALTRAAAFRKAGGFRAELIAGEEPELCVRLRAASWRIWQLDHEMARHDAAITRFGQWWKRSLRSGYGYAQGADIHGAPPERLWVREARSAWFWGLCIPAGTLALVPWYGTPALVLLLLYPLQIVRLALRGERSARENWWSAWFLVLGKFPAMMGQIKYRLHWLFGRSPRLIEYK